jgi:Asp-tRNA(Asn)/Glu-tRNA(Gln) amidotransferase A subunit family amidase
MVLPLDEDVCARILAGKRVSARQYLDALAEQGRIKAQFAAALDAFDVLSWPRRPSGRLPSRWITWTKQRLGGALPVP